MQITFWHLLVLFAASKFECKPNDKHENVTSNEQNTGKPEFALKKVDVVARVRGKRSMHFQQEKCSRMRGWIAKKTESLPAACSGQISQMI